MFSRLEDELIDHRKIFIAGAKLGRDGPAIALGLYAVGLMYSNKHLTDGYLPFEVVKGFSHCAKPLVVAEALVQAGLWEQNGSGFVIHDFADFNFAAADVKARRKQDRLRKHAPRPARMRSH